MSFPLRSSFKAGLGWESSPLASPTTSGQSMEERQEEGWRKVGRNLFKHKRANILNAGAKISLREKLGPELADEVLKELGKYRSISRKEDFTQRQLGQKRRFLRMAKRVENGDEGKCNKTDDENNQSILRLVLASLRVKDEWQCSGRLSSPWIQSFHSCPKARQRSSIFRILK